MVTSANLFINSPFARKAKNFNEILITRDVIPGCSGGYVKCMAVMRKIATSSFKIPAKSAL